MFETRLESLPSSVNKLIALWKSWLIFNASLNFLLTVKYRILFRELLDLKCLDLECQDLESVRSCLLILEKWKTFLILFQIQAWFYSDLDKVLIPVLTVYIKFLSYHKNFFLQKIKTTSWESYDSCIICWHDFKSVFNDLIKTSSFTGLKL